MRFKVSALWLVIIILISGCAESSSSISNENSDDFVEIRGHAQAGDPIAEYELGKSYFEGNGVDKDLSKAIQWFQKSANSGIDDAQYTLAFLFSEGVYLQKDLKKAANWFELAARQGHAESQYRLGLLYSKGQGIEKNISLAFAWFAFAEKGGKMESRLELIQLRKSMSALEISEALRTQKELEGVLRDHL